jgi:agmatine deiminase
MIVNFLKISLSARKAGLLSVLILVIIFACTPSSEEWASFTDFDEQESTMICWNEQHKNTLIPLIARISMQDQVTLFYNEKYHRPGEVAAQLLGSGAELEKVTLSPFSLEKDNIWIRDYGPSFMKDTKGNARVVGFGYPHQEYTDYQNFAESFSLRMKIQFYKSRLQSVGGGREVNGKGTILLIEGYEKEINPGLSKAEIEEEYRLHFGQKHFIWLKRGIPQDDFMGYGPLMDNIYGYGTNWHVDEFCRFVDANTLLLAEVSDEDMERHPFYRLVHERLDENYHILKNATDQDGNPFKIIRVPQAPVIFTASQRDNVEILYTPVTSYLNFVITNHSVIIPTYHTEGAADYIRQKDEEAMSIFRQVFPTREVWAVNALELNHKGGGLHCVTLPQPKKNVVKKSSLFSFFRKRS